MQVACGVPAAITIDAARGLRLAFARSESREFDAPPPEYLSRRAWSTVVEWTIAGAATPRGSSEEWIDRRTFANATGANERAARASRSSASGVKHANAR
jgi:hypothetical protein